MLAAVETVAAQNIQAAPCWQADHLRFAGASFELQRTVLEAILREDRLMMDVLRTLRAAALPDWLVTSGAIYNLVWNRLTGRPPHTGIKDIDVAYFDAKDLGYAAEDRVIRSVGRLFGPLPLPVEIRNQARVHMWFSRRFRLPYAPLASAAESLGRYATRAHAVAVRLLADDSLAVVAPFGLDDIFSFRLVPNTALANRETHERKAARAKSIWPELTVVPWPE